MQRGWWRERTPQVASPSGDGDEASPELVVVVGWRRWQERMPRVANPSEEDVADFRSSGPGWCQHSKSTQSPGGTYLSRSVARLGLDCV